MAKSNKNKNKIQRKENKIAKKVEKKISKKIIRKSTPRIIGPMRPPKYKQGQNVNEGQVNRMKQFIQNTLTVSGTDYLTDLTLTSAVTTSTVINQIILNPLSLVPASRLARFALLYDKYKFNKLRLRYKTAVGTGTGGQFQMAFDYDPDDNYQSSTGPTLNSQLSGCADNMEFPAYHNAILSSTSKSPVLFVQSEAGGDQRLVNWGRVWIATIGGMPAGTYGYFELDWSITFSKPNNDPDSFNTVFAAYANSITPSATYPWGNYPVFPDPGYGTTWNPSIVRVLNVVPGTATAASVIQFMQAGNYLVLIYRTGVALTFAAYTPTGLSNCTVSAAQVVAPSPAGPGTTIGTVGSEFSTQTRSFGAIAVNCSVAGGYIYATGDSGPTHSSATITVIRMPATAVNPPTPSAPPLDMNYLVEQVRKQLVHELNLSSKQPPVSGRATVPFPNSSFSGEVTGTISSQDPYTNTPGQTFNFNLDTNGDADIGYDPLNPISTVVEAPLDERSFQHQEDRAIRHLMELRSQTQFRMDEFSAKLDALIRKAPSQQKPAESDFSLLSQKMKEEE